MRNTLGRAQKKMGRGRRIMARDRRALRRDALARDWIQLAWPWIGPLVLAAFAAVWALRPSMTRRMLIAEVVIALVIVDLLAFAFGYLDAGLLASAIGTPAAINLWLVGIHALYFHVVVVIGAWAGWTIHRRQSPVRSGAHGKQAPLL